MLGERALWLNVVVWCLLACMASAQVWKHCGTANDLLDIEEVVLTPDPPKRGNLHIEGKGYLKGVVDKGSQATVTAKWGLIRLPVKNPIDVCDALDMVDTGYACPVQSGNVSLSMDVDIPKQTPPGRYTINVNAKNQDGKPITCLKINVKF